MTGLRIGDAERETALSALGEHFAQGRLSREEHAERSDAVWSSRTADDLVPHGSPVRPSGPSRPGPAPAGPGVRNLGDHGERARMAFRGLPTGAKALLVVLAAVIVLANLPLVVVAGVLWFVLSRHGVARPPWASRRCGPPVPRRGAW